jgi:K+-transporting ATPase ATPase C chain
MLTELRRGAVAVVAFTVLVGLAYPLLVSAIGRVAFGAAADGSLVRRPDGRVAGSRLIGQAFDAPGYLWGRPSAAGGGYDAGASGASNLDPTLVRDLVRRHTEGRDLWVLGEPRVNVLELNLALGTVSRR